ncbi:MAG: hypothetical protein ACR2PL_26495 [Dehalococcoidia bacterium]
MKKTLELQIDEDLLEKAYRQADARGCSLEDVIRAFLRQMTVPEVANDPIWGMFRDEPALEDQVLEEIMKDRDRRWVT